MKGFDYTTLTPENAKRLKELAESAMKLHQGVPPPVITMKGVQELAARELARQRLDAAQRMKRRPVSVMFLEAIGSGRVLIEDTQDVFARIAQLQPACPVPLTLIGLIDASKFTTVQIHGMFSGDRVLGKWFTITDEIRSFITNHGIK